MLVNDFGGDSSSAEMILIPGGSVEMGGDNDQAAEDEFPKHKFLYPTGYRITAERKPDWEELKRSVPSGTPKPVDSLLIAASLGFRKITVWLT